MEHLPDSLRDGLPQDVRASTGKGVDQCFAKEIAKLRTDKGFIECRAFIGDTLDMLINYRQGVGQGYYGFGPT